MRYSFLFASLLFAVGCSGSDDSTPVTPTDSGTADATTDTAKPDGSGADTAKSETATDTGGTTEDAAGISCGDAVCGMGQVCCASGDPDSGFKLACATGSSCPDGGATISCDGPEDCPAGAKICCAEVNVEGTLPSCTFKTGVSECRGTCTSNVPATCPSTATVRRCHAAADCTETEYKNCCVLESGGASAEFCAPDYMKLLAKSCK